MGSGGQRPEGQRIKKGGWSEDQQGHRVGGSENQWIRRAASWPRGSECYLVRGYTKRYWSPWGMALGFVGRSVGRSRLRVAREFVYARTHVRRPRKPNAMPANYSLWRVRREQRAIHELILAYTCVSTSLYFCCSSLSQNGRTCNIYINMD